MQYANFPISCDPNYPNLKPPLCALGVTFGEATSKINKIKIKTAKLMNLELIGTNFQCSHFDSERSYMYKKSGAICLHKLLRIYDEATVHINTISLVLFC